MPNNNWTIQEVRDFALNKITDNYFENGERTTTFDNLVSQETENFPPKDILLDVLEGLESEGKISVVAKTFTSYTVKLTTRYQRNLENEAST